LRIRHLEIGSPTVTESSEGVKNGQDEEEGWVFDCSCGLYGQVDDHHGDLGSNEYRRATYATSCFISLQLNVQKYRQIRQQSGNMKCYLPEYRHERLEG
jgi:hypothetical protein